MLALRALAAMRPANVSVAFVRGTTANYAAPKVSEKIGGAKGSEPSTELIIRLA